MGLCAVPKKNVTFKEQNEKTSKSKTESEKALENKATIGTAEEKNWV